MDEWDQEKLEAVVNQKHGTEKNRPTDIICKFFLDAVERKQYGWCASFIPPHCRVNHGNADIRLQGRELHCKLCITLEQRCHTFGLLAGLAMLNCIT